MKKLIGLLIVLAMGISFISGCSSSSTTANWNPLNSGKEIKIAVLGSEEQFENFKDFFAGADMAVEELKASGLSISYEKLDDEGNYDNAVNIAQRVANNSDYTLAITMQDVDVMGPISFLFNEAEKPLIIASQALSRMMSSGFAYVLNTTLLAAEQGYLAGQVAIQNNVKWVTAVHSEAQFDKEFINGFQLATQNSQTTLMDVRELTTSLGDLKEILTAFTALKPDAVLVAHHNAENLVNAIENIRARLDDTAIFTNAEAIDANVILESKDVLTNVSGVTQYPVDETEEAKDFAARYKSQYGIGITGSACQGYDIINLIAEKIEGTTSALDFMNNAKSEEGYVGTTTLRFDIYGRLVTETANKFSIDASGNITLEHLTF